MGTYWRVYKDAYPKLKEFPTSMDKSLHDTLYKNIKDFQSIYICKDDNYDYYNWMPLYHKRKSGGHSDKPGPDRYDSKNYFRENNFIFGGNIGGRKQKLQKIKELNEQLWKI